MTELDIENAHLVYLRSYPCFLSHSRALIFFRVSGSMSSTCFFFLACLWLTHCWHVHLGDWVHSGTWASLDPGGGTL